MQIDLQHITKAYPVPGDRQLPVLDGIDLSITEGDFVVILGQSGCGKSTLLNIMAGLMTPTTGQVLIDDVPLIAPNPAILLLFQSPSLLPWLSVEQNIAFGCRLRGEVEELDYRVRQFIEIIGLSGFEESSPQELSVGMAFRVSLARALIGRPQVLLMDEPFGSLDTFTRTRLQEELVNIWLSEKFTAVCVTHDIEEAILLGSKIVVLGDEPSRIRDVIPIDFEYPRKITSTALFETKRRIIERFKKAFYE